MASISSAIDDAREILEKRLAELDNERKRVERALSNLVEGKTRRGPGRPKGSTSKKSGAPKRRRRRRGGTRADQAVKLIEANPGISASEIAKTMRIKPNYLYRVLGDLEKERRVKKKGRQYTAA